VANVFSSVSTLTLCCDGKKKKNQERKKETEKQEYTAEMEVHMKKSIRTAYLQAVDLSNHNRSDITAYEMLSCL